MLDYAAIGKRIRKYRKLRELSQEALAERIWISATHMSHIETGSTKLSLPVLADIAKALDVSTDTLLFGESPDPAGASADEVERILKVLSKKQLSLLSELIESFK